MIRYVSVYKVERCWGGPEEGGWWYDFYTLIESTEVLRRDRNRVLRAKRKEWESQNTVPLHSVMSRGIYNVVKEENKGEHETKERPIYE